jgi:hypothetical protein
MTFSPHDLFSHPSLFPPSLLYPPFLFPTDNFLLSTQEEELPIAKPDMEEFAECWARYDPGGTQYIPARALASLLADLAPPLGVRGTGSSLLDIQMIILTSDVPTRHERLHFMETLHALTARVAGTPLPLQAQLKAHRKLASRLPKGASNATANGQTAAHYYAALYVQAAVRGMLTRQRGGTRRGRLGAMRTLRPSQAALLTQSQAFASSAWSSANPLQEEAEVYTSVEGTLLHNQQPQRQQHGGVPAAGGHY